MSAKMTSKESPTKSSEYARKVTDCKVVRKDVGKDIVNSDKYNAERIRENIINQLQKILRKGRDEEWEDKSDFEEEEYDFFVSAEKSDIRPGRFEEFGSIPDDKIREMKCSVLKEKPLATKSELSSILVKKFYGDSSRWDLNLSFKLSQCIRSGTDCFDEAKNFLLKQGYDIYRNDFL